MLARLVKYEIRSTARYFLPVYAAILIFSLLIGLRDFDEAFLSSLNIILPTALGLSFMGLGVMTLIMVVKRFDSNLLGDEGYLMFTLPVKTSGLIASKLITSMVWVMLSYVIFFLSILLIGWKKFDLAELWRMLREFPMDPYLLVVFILLILMSILHFLLQIYASLSIAQAYTITRSRILGGTIVFILFGMGINFLETLFATGAAFLLEDNAWFNNLFLQLESENFQSVAAFFRTAFTFYLVYITLKNVIFYFLTKHHLDKKLNLE